MKYYHVTKAKNVESILKKGFRCARRSNFPHLTYHRECGIWVFDKHYSAVWWSKFHDSVYKEPAFFEINAAGLPVEEDEMLQDWLGSYLIKAYIHPDRITFLYERPYTIGHNRGTAVAVA